jgi:dihydroxyacid dehydratase/phosphogluconate dehydratase
MEKRFLSLADVVETLNISMAQGYALVRTGDPIAVDVEARRIDMVVSDAELAARREAWRLPEPRFARGYGWMFSRHIGQAHEGCDFDFLETGFGPSPDEPAIL